MSFTNFIISAPSTERRTFKPVPAGTHVAICIGLVDIGFQPAFELGQPPQHKIWMNFELPGERIASTDADGNPSDEPSKIGAFYTFSLHEKAKLRSVLESLRGTAFTKADAKNFDLTSVLGKPCMLSVTHRLSGDRTWANIAGTVSLPKGVPAPAAESPLLLFPAKNDPSALDRVPEFIRKKIDEQLPPPERAYARRAAAPAAVAPVAAVAVEDLDDALPF